MTNLVGELRVRPLNFLLGNVSILKNYISFVDKNKTEHIIGKWVACSFELHPHTLQSVLH